MTLGTDGHRQSALGARMGDAMKFRVPGSGLLCVHAVLDCSGEGFADRFAGVIRAAQLGFDRVLAQRLRFGE